MHGVLAWVAVCTAIASPAAALSVPLAFYTGENCKNASTITPGAAGNVSECVISPGMVSLHYDFVGCAGGGKVTPYFFKDTGCRTPLDFLQGPTKTGDDFRCYTVFRTTVAAFMLSCAANDSVLEAPTATRTVSIGPVATGAAAATSSAASSDSNDSGSRFVNGWKALSLGAQIGIIVGGSIFVLLVLTYCFWNSLAYCLGACCGDCCSRPRPRPTPRPYDDRPPPRKRPDVREEEVPPDNDDTGTWYARVLSNVVDTARQHAASGAFDTDVDGSGSRIRNARAPLPEHTVDMAFPSADEDRLHKMGAAGELYMFEYLRSLNLPNFGIDNWPSEIRDRVSEHPDYRYIRSVQSQAWTDIEYYDWSCNLTRFLIRQGHWGEEMQNRRLTYHIEVKATTVASWGRPFYINDRQKRHIESDLLADDHVYVICRVYGLGRGAQTGLRVYVDPQRSFDSGALTIERGPQRHTWTVTPMH